MDSGNVWKMPKKLESDKHRVEHSTILWSCKCNQLNWATTEDAVTLDDGEPEETLYATCRWCGEKVKIDIYIQPY